MVGMAKSDTTAFRLSNLVDITKLRTRTYLHWYALPMAEHYRPRTGGRAHPHRQTEITQTKHGNAEP